MKQNVKDEIHKLEETIVRNVQAERTILDMINLIKNIKQAIDSLQYTNKIQCDEPDRRRP